MRTIWVKILLLFLIVFFLQNIPEKIYAANPNCDIKIEPATGSVDVETFEATVTLKDTPSNWTVQRIELLKKIGEIFSKKVRNLSFAETEEDTISISEFGPFFKDGDYRLSVVISRGSGGIGTLCSSQDLKINPPPTPTPGGPTLTPTPVPTCDPPGRNRKNLNICLDTDCVAVGGVFRETPTVNSKCEVKELDIASPEAPTPTNSPLPCAQWAYSFPKDHKNSRLNGEPIPPGNKGYGDDPDYENRKCIAMNTAIGNIHTEPQKFVKDIFGIVLGLAGGIALILIMVSGYRFMASQGNPEAVQAARDQLISAIVGLLFIIFSFVILQVIGVDILKIPGFKP